MVGIDINTRNAVTGNFSNGDLISIPNDVSSGSDTTSIIHISEDRTGIISTIFLFGVGENVEVTFSESNGTMITIAGTILVIRQNELALRRLDGGEETIRIDGSVSIVRA